jgi:hypothetical protein
VSLPTLFLARFSGESHRKVVDSLSSITQLTSNTLDCCPSDAASEQTSITYGVVAQQTIVTLENEPAILPALHDVRPL